MKEPPSPISTLRYATALSQGNRHLASRGLSSIEIRRLQQQMLDANGETPVTKFVIERHQHEAVGVLEGAVGPGSAMPIYSLMYCSGDGVAVNDQKSCPPYSPTSRPT